MRPILAGVSIVIFLLIVFLAVRTPPRAAMRDVSPFPEFPADIPLEEGAHIVGNYTAVTPDGVSQVSVVFESSRSVQENFAFYRNFFAQKGAWQFIGEVPPGEPDTSHGAVFARNEKGALDVNISSTSFARASMVALSFRKGGR
jgi:hypothetical protein